MASKMVPKKYENRCQTATTNDCRNGAISKPESAKNGKRVKISKSHKTRRDETSRGETRRRDETKQDETKRRRDERDKTRRDFMTARAESLRALVSLARIL